MSESSIRIATEADLPVIIDMAMKFAEQSIFFKFVSKSKITSIVESLIKDDNTKSIIFVYEDKGMLAASIVPFVFGDDVKLATEIAWWVEPEARMSGVGKILMNAFEYWVEKIGAKVIFVSCLDDTVGKFFEKNGYQLYERSYIKEI